MVVTANRDVLISGVGVAGPTPAYWLHRYGFRPSTLIPRTSRQVWLTPYPVGLLPRLPSPIQRGLLSLQGDPAPVLGGVSVKRYD